MIKFLKHLLTPHKRNNHRARVLHHSSLVIIILFIFSVTFLGYNINKSHPDVLGVSYSISESDLLALVNQQRVSNGLPALVENSELADAARRKAADMFQKNYWAHFAPDGSTSPWGFIRAAGYNYQFAGENLAKGFTDSSSAVNAWMNSSSHRENILSTHFKDVGFAVVPGTLQGEDTVLIVQEFGSTAGENLAVLPPATTASAQSNVAGQETNAQSPKVLPTPTPIQAKVVVKTASASQPAHTAVVNKPKIDVSITSKAATSVALSFIGFGLLMDLVIIERKKIPRIVGHNLDHIMLILTFILFMIILKGGVII